MPGNPIISICIPTYNGERYLEECLDSCMNQTYENYEIVICDDFSSDSTAHIIEKYAAVNPKIRFFKNERNLGLVGNWNRCIEMAQGEWIKFVFQDDYIAKNCLQKFMEAIQPSTVLVVSERDFILPGNASGDFLQYYREGVRTLANTTDYKGKHFSGQLISVIAAQNIGMNFIGEPTLTFFKKSMITQLGNFKDSLKQICDLEFFLRIASNYGLDYIPEKICSFRIHQDSTTSKNIKNKFFELRYIEPLLFVYFLLYDAKFKNFRKSLNVFQLLKLRIYFKVKTYHANRVNRDENHGHYLFENSGAAFKEIYANRNGNLWIKTIALFKK